MPEIGFVVIGANTGTKEFDFAREGDGVKVGQLGDFAAGQIKVVKIGAVVAI